MKRKRVHLFLIVCVLLGTSLPAAAWDETGHKIVAYIAWQQMRPEVRDNVFRLMLTAPEDAQLSTFYMPYGSQSDATRRRDFFMIAATWPDMIKDKIFQTRFKKYNNSNWHYFDTVWTLEKGKVVFVQDAEESGKMMEKLADFDKLIRSSSASDPDKAIAITWLAHLIGDLHQPLHTTARAYGDDKKGDQGGNLFALTPKGTTRDLADNLHKFWDSAIGRNIPNSGDACDADYLIPIAQTILNEYPYSKVQNRLSPGKFDVWEKESVELSTTELYKGLTRYEQPSESYKKKAFAIAKERIALAGYRLGDLFNEVFGAPPSTNTVPVPPKP